MQKLLITFISIYSGLIATLCLDLGLVKLARHGYLTWGDLIYPSKLIWLAIGAYVYYYMTKQIKNKSDDQSTLSFLIKLSPIRLGILAIATVIVGVTLGERVIGQLHWLLFIW